MFEEKEITFEIVGKTPLLMHNQEAMGSTGKAKTRSDRIPSPHEEARKGLYVLPDGQLYIPLSAFLQSAIKAAGKYRIGKQSLSHVLAGSVLTDEGVCPLIYPDTRKPLTNCNFDEWEVIKFGVVHYDLPDRFIDLRRVVVPATRGAVLRARPRIQRWATYVTYCVDTTVFDDAELFLKLVQDSGRYVGILDYRPEKRGSYGRFVATLVETPKKKSKK